MNGCFIPKKIKVGFQERKDTYSGKLAYVIYYDEKNNLRKEQSWNSWRDKNIEHQEFENECLEGFVLNKKSGDYRGSNFSGRLAHIRVYDPRGFEIEITVDNLLYILENCNCIKGKGLEGRFCYSWNGQDLILLPEDSLEFKNSKKYSSTLFENKKIKKSDIQEGKTYILKGNEKVVYLGFVDKIYPYNYGIIECNGSICRKEHCYVNVDEIFSENFTIRYSSTFNPVSELDEEFNYAKAKKVLEDSLLISGKFIRFYNEKEIKSALKSCKEGFKAWSTDDKYEFKTFQKKTKETVTHRRRNCFYDVELNSKEIERWYNLYYVSIYENGILVGKEKEIEIF